MKIIAIGDTHGRTIWQQIVEKEKDADKIVFIGDYFDSHDNISGDIQIQNFENLLQFKRDNPKQVILLFGNHDYHYIVDEAYSGYNRIYASQFGEVIKKAISENLVQMCYKIGEAIFTHAGITNQWLQNNGYYDLDDEKNMQDFINDKFRYKPLAFRFVGQNPYGDSIEASPIWVRPKSLMQDPPKFEELTQIVGHTHQNLTTIDRGDKLKYAFIDSLELNEKGRVYSSYLELEIDEHVTSGEDHKIQSFQIKRI